MHSPKYEAYELMSWVWGMGLNEVEEGQENFSCGENHGSRVQTSEVNPQRHCRSYRTSYLESHYLRGKGPIMSIIDNAFVNLKRKYQEKYGQVGLKHR